MSTSLLNRRVEPVGCAPFTDKKSPHRPLLNLLVGCLIACILANSDICGHDHNSSILSPLGQRRMRRVIATVGHPAEMNVAKIRILPTCCLCSRNFVNYAPSPTHRTITVPISRLIGRVGYPCQSL